MTKKQILARMDELLDQRGIMLVEVLNATEVRKNEIYEWFDGMREELTQLARKMREVTANV